jgi:hypothetical protein
MKVTIDIPLTLEQTRDALKRLTDLVVANAPDQADNTNERANYDNVLAVIESIDLGELERKIWLS